MTYHSAESAVPIDHPSVLTAQEDNDYQEQLFLEALPARRADRAPRSVDEFHELDRGFDARLGYERIAVSDLKISRKIDYITNLLAYGENLGVVEGVESGAPYYFEAIKVADREFEREGLRIARSIPEFAEALRNSQDEDSRRLILYDAISAARASLLDQITLETDPATRQRLEQHEMDLHSLQRAPGFTRANCALLRIRFGDFDAGNSQDPALIALNQAVVFDREMMPSLLGVDNEERADDPNFVRLVQEITGINAGDPAAFERDLRMFLAGQLPALPSIDQDSNLDEGGTNTAEPGESDASSPIAPSEDVTSLSLKADPAAEDDVEIPPSPQSDDVGSPGAGEQIDANEREFEAAPDKEAALTLMQDRFEQAISTADQEFNDFVDTNASVYIELESAHNDIIAEMTPETRDRLQSLMDSLIADESKSADLLQQLDQIFSTIPSEDQELIKKLHDPNTPEEEKQELELSLRQKYEQLFTVDESYNDTLEHLLETEETLSQEFPELIAIDQQLQTMSQEHLGLALNKFAARVDYARALSLAGDNETARPIMDEALRRMISDTDIDTVGTVLSSPEGRELADLSRTLGIDPENLTRTDGGTLDVSRADGEELAESGEISGSQRESDDSLLAGGLEQQVSALLEDGGQKLQDGDVAAARQSYEKAISLIDSTVDVDRINQLQDVLESGSHDGSQLSAEDRVAMHLELMGMFENAMISFDLRRNYAIILKEYGQFASAESAYKDLVGYADQLPIEAMKREMKLIDDELSLTQDEEWIGVMSDFSTIMQGGGNVDESWLYARVNSRKMLAYFYVTLNAVPDPENPDQPLMNADGSLKYMPDTTGVFKPELAFEVIEEAKEELKLASGGQVDLDQNPEMDRTLAWLAKGVYDNSTPELKKKYEHVSKYWQSGVSDTVAGAAGVLTTLGLAALAIKVPVVRRALPAALATESKLTPFGWASVSVLGGASASGVRHEMVTKYYGRDDEDLKTSLLHGFASTASGLVLTRGANYGFSRFGGRIFTTEGTVSRLAATYGDEAKAFEALKANGLHTPKGVTTLSEYAGTLDNAGRSKLLASGLSFAQKGEGRFSGLRSSFAIADGAAGKSRVIAGAPLKTLYTVIGEPGAGVQSISAKAIGFRRYWTGAGAVVASSAAYDYPMVWNEIASGALDPETGKPMELNLENALLRPGRAPWQSVWVNPITLGAFARPGMLHITPGGAGSSPFKRMFHSLKGLATGDEAYLYPAHLVGSGRYSPLAWRGLGAEAVPAAANTLFLDAVRRTLPQNSNRDEADTYKELLESAQRPITDMPITPQRGN